jgi:hypothetical protein
MKQLLINRLESILAAVGGAVPAPLMASNFRARSLQLAELILVRLGGSIPAIKVVDNYDSRILLILEQCLIAKGQALPSLTGPVGNYSDRLLSLLGQLLVYGGGSVAPLAAPTNRNARLMQLMDGLLAVAANFVAPAMQAETTAYENRVIALGSTLPANRKAAIDAFMVTIKGQSYFSKIKLLWLGCGPSSVAGLAAQLIHPTNLDATLTGFTAVHYNASGSPLGLLGGASPNRIVNHNFAPNLLTSGDASMFAYVTTLTSGSNVDFSMGALTGDFSIIMPNFNGTTGYVYLPSGSNPATLAVSAYGGNPAFIVGTRSGNLTTSYINGAFHNAGALLAGALPNTGSTYSLYSSSYGYSPRRVALSGCGALLSGSEVTHFSTQVATLIAALAT